MHQSRGAAYFCARGRLHVPDASMLFRPRASAGSEPEVLLHSSRSTPVPSRGTRGLLDRVPAAAKPPRHCHQNHEINAFHLRFSHQVIRRLSQTRQFINHPRSVKKPLPYWGSAMCTSNGRLHSWATRRMISLGHNVWLAAYPARRTVAHGRNFDPHFLPP